MVRLVLLTTLCLTLSCRTTHSVESPTKILKQAKLIRSFALSDPGARGLSGLSRLDQRWVTVAERSGYIYFFDGQSIDKFPIVGVPVDIDLEGVAVLDERTLLLSTESNNTDNSASAYESLFIATKDNEAYTVSKTVIIPPSNDWNFQHNTGLEGVCVTQSRVWSTAEVVFEKNNRRYGPLLSFSRERLESDEIIQPTWYSVELGSHEGKLTALDCREDQYGTRIWAIERHFGVSRLIEIKIPTGSNAMLPLSSELIFDLTSIMENNENFEGLVYLDNHRWALINDNEYTGISGPSKLWIVK